ncbi:hypothetical protein OBBRIDRAFT_825152 [Obba rivulosa]|uniref:F-box domain-containing protein n=1 Tax=Obba rivulosa TaxID=1052685 RepID=A0A8E2B0N6_9APHY|nr:hypothetical protein OBBRIDRAFT_825152 [Obba rivulosa]
MLASIPVRSHTGQAIPINYLPVELLSLIFTFGADSRTVLNESGMGIRRSESHRIVSPCQRFDPGFPLLVSAVCKRWRAVALGQKTLWSKIHVTSSDVAKVKESEYKPGHIFPRVALYLQRAGKSALDILIDTREPNCAALNYQQLLELMLPDLDRWRSFALVTDSSYPMGDALSYLTARVHKARPSGCAQGPLAPMLERIAFIHQKDIAFTIPFRLGLRQYPADPMPFGVSNTPRLQHLILSGVSLNWPLISQMLPLPSPTDPKTGLQTLELSRPSADDRPSAQDLNRILDRCSSLESLTFRCMGPSELVGEDAREDRLSKFVREEPQPLLHLKDFTVEYNQPTDALFILESVEAPNVCKLKVENMSPENLRRSKETEHVLDRYAGIVPGIRNTLRNIESRFPLVKTLVLHRIHANRKCLKRFFAAFPLTEQLTLSSPSPEACRALVARDTDAGRSLLCPSLHELFIWEGGALDEIKAKDILTYRKHEGQELPLHNTGLGGFASSDADEPVAVGQTDSADRGDTEVIVGTHTAASRVASLIKQIFLDISPYTRPSKDA